jgi:hypothetical protein
MNRIAASNFEDALRSKVVNDTINSENEHSRIFWFAQVIDNKDPKNLNRIKVRIPVIDEVKYVGVEKEKGDANLPWCLPTSHRFLNTPEVNSIVIVAILDPKTPYYGRIYFDTITDLTDTDIFERLEPEKTLSDFSQVEKALNIEIFGKPKDKAFNGKDNIKYPIGLRGKGKNKFMLDKDSSLWVQNEGDKDNESHIKLEKSLMDFDAADKIDILSKKGNKTKYNPLFHSTMYTYLSDVNKMIQKIVILLNTQPALAKCGPCMASPNAPTLMSDLIQLNGKLQKLKQEGHSKKIRIN